MAKKPETFLQVIDRRCCQFITGDLRTPDHSFCSRPRTGKSAYCKKHYDLCVTESKPLNSKILEEEK